MNPARREHSCDRELRGRADYSAHRGTPARFVCSCGQAYEYTDDEAEGGGWSLVGDPPATTENLRDQADSDAIRGPIPPAPAVSADPVDRFVEAVVAAKPWTGLADLTADELARLKGAADTTCLLDRAAAAREISTFVALVLIQAQGDPAAALALCEEVAGQATPEAHDELDAVSIGAQAIREALSLRRGR